MSEVRRQICGTRRICAHSLVFKLASIIRKYIAESGCPDILKEFLQTVVLIPV